MVFNKKREKDVLRTRTSRKLYLPFYFMIFFLILVLVFLKFRGYKLSNLALIIVGIFIFLIFKFTEIHRICTLYEVNPEALVHTSGIFNKVSKHVDFFAISDIDVSQKFWQRLFNFGDVNIRLFSRESTTAVKNISKPYKFADFLEKSISRKRGGKIGGMSA